MKTREELHDLIRRAKRNGFSDRQLATLWGMTELEVRALRKSLGLNPVYKTVDTCGAEFEAETPYHYSTYETETEVRPSDRKKVMILGSGPNRIGQGIEFDYCCVHAVFALQEDGYETIMVNSNPETVSTDYDTADRLYFEPLTFEDVLNIIEAEKPIGVIVQLGGQTPLKLAVPLEKAGVPILGTSPDSIDLAEDRKRFGKLADDLGIPIPPYGTARSFAEALEVATRITFPVLVRPSYVLGGRAMEIVYDQRTLERYMEEAVQVSPEHPILVDKYLDSAIEVDVDALCDGKEVYIGGIMEHVEYAGVHSGDSACVIPPRSLPGEVLDQIREYTRKLALGLKVCGLINIQFAVKRNGKDMQVYVLEVNPRASRTVPFVSKATGIPLAKAAARLMTGRTLKDLGLHGEAHPEHISVKEAVLPFIKFAGVDTVLGPEMKSTGEVMGIDRTFGMAYAKSQISAGTLLPLPQTGKTVFISVNDHDKPLIRDTAQSLVDLGFKLIATKGTRDYLAGAGVACDLVFKVNEGRPHVVDRMKDKEIALVINTPLGAVTEYDEKSIRRCAVENNIPYVTTVAAAHAAVDGIAAMGKELMTVQALQDYHKG